MCGFGLRLRTGLADDLHDLSANLLEIDPERFQHTGRDTFALADKAEQQVLRSDVVVVQSASFVDGKFDNLLCARRQTYLAHDCAFTATNDELNGGADFWQLNAHVVEYTRGDAVAFADKPKQQVFGADVVMVEALGLFLGELQHFSCAFREFVKLCHYRGLPKSQTLALSNGRCDSIL